MSIQLFVLFICCTSSTSHDNKAGPAFLISSRLRHRFEETPSCECDNNAERQEQRKPCLQRNVRGDKDLLELAVNRRGREGAKITQHIVDNIAESVSRLPDRQYADKREDRREKLKKEREMPT